MSHPIPQELRDRFDQIERDIMGNKMSASAVFTQMRTAVQTHFMKKCDGNHGGGQCRDPECWNGGAPLNLPKYRAVSAAQLTRVLMLLDPPPVHTPSGKTMVFVNPMAADVLTLISAELRAMMAEPVPQPVPGVTWEAQGEANEYTLFKDGHWLAAVRMNGMYLVAQHELFLNSLATPHVCTIPPAGWTCSRRAGHDGPCAASPVVAD